MLDALPPQPVLATRWLVLERQLAAIYAESYLRIWKAIAAANTSKQETRLSHIVERSLNRPDHARSKAIALEEQLVVPDCTGGENTAPSPMIAYRP